MRARSSKEKHLDLIAANLIGPPDSGFAADTNRMTLFFADGSKKVLDVMDKDAVAHLILDQVVENKRSVPESPSRKKTMTRTTPLACMIRDIRNT
jgi:phosphopantothenoylcysteine synthetase/decarboxylase